MSVVPRFTKKKKHEKNLKQLWNHFDDNKTENVECVYSYESKNRECCDTCNYPVALSDEGFYICTNNKCSILYKDTLDQGAEWRYYGASDNGNDDPTRCGMPINPLLKESSFGCRVRCTGKSTYEMRQISRYTEWQAMPYKEKSQYE